jgi:hypothetical protein
MESLLKSQERGTMESSVRNAKNAHVAKPLFFVPISFTSSIVNLTHLIDHHFRRMTVARIRIE